MQRHDVALEPDPPLALRSLTGGDDVHLDLLVTDKTQGSAVTCDAEWLLYRDAIDDVLIVQGVFIDGAALIPGDATHGLRGAYILRVVMTFDAGERQTANYLIKFYQ